MTHLALVALLSGALLTGSPDGDQDKKKSPSEAPQPEVSIVDASSEDPEALTNLTYAFGRPSDLAPIKLWVAYAFGESEGVWAADGEGVEYDLDGPGPGNLSGDIVSQRALVGAQINFINFPAFKLGAGGELVVAQNKFQPGTNSDLGNDLESDFGLQQVKVFGTARGRVVGVHGGYIFDLADDVMDPTTEFPLSDQRDALFFGGDFDYPSERFRLFGGADYFILQDDDEAEGAEGNNIIWWNMGAGLRFGFVELGASLMIRTQLVEGAAAGLAFGPRTSDDNQPSTGTNVSGGHAGTVVPYLKLAPPSLPVSLFVKGAVLNEYTDYGYAIGGANDIKPSLGFTAGLSIGFN
ncbi:MAG: hypothetical protein R3181_08505 [Rubricoccaceae bacterium]|nr:hypothetical protein [Rubricoccaceae bacterium]